MGIIAIDLGTTNIKVASYTDDLQPLAIESHTVTYRRSAEQVEFDAARYFDDVAALVRACHRQSLSRYGDGPVALVLTGQAESLVVTDEGGKPLRGGISWLDNRSTAECAALAGRFDRETCYRVTGQPEIIPTWPLTKLLWLRRHEGELFARAAKFLMLKDFILHGLTGRFVGEHSIYPFTHYFDIRQKCYWTDILDYCGVRTDQLPELVEPCSWVGELCAAAREKTGLPAGSRINCGTLDHFAGMIGTGNVREGMVSESAGTVSSIATFTSGTADSGSKIPLYSGPFPDSYIYLPVCESGGLSLEWFRGQFLSERSFGDIDRVCLERAPDARLTFLPYLTGVNPPEFNPDATGVFYGLRAGHDAYDLALATMYGVACLLRKNIDHFRRSGIAVEQIISTGGGAKSALWSQIKADVCALPVAVPENREAPCLGAAIIGAVSAGTVPDYATATAQCVQTGCVYTPRAQQTPAEEKYQLFCRLYDALEPVFGS